LLDEEIEINSGFIVKGENRIMYYQRLSGDNNIHSAMIASDVMMFIGALFSLDKAPEEALKIGEVAYKGLRKPRLKIYDPDNPAHYVECKNNLSYPQNDTNVVYMNPVDYSYFIQLGFEAGDTVYIVEA